MTNGKIAAVTIGVAGAIVLGALAIPSLMHREPTVAEPSVAVEPAPVEAEKPATPVHRAKAAPKDARVATKERTIAPAVVPSLPASEPELHARLKPVLNSGTRMADAAAGFRDAEQFAAVAHAARNTNVPFVVLKHRVLDEKQTLAQAIRASRPDVDVSREVARAHDAARFDIAVITS
jgi:hypothetical protein